MSYGPVKYRAESLQKVLKDQHGIDSILEPVDVDSDITVEKDGKFLLTRHYKTVNAAETASAIKMKI